MKFRLLPINTLSIIILSVIGCLLLLYAKLGSRNSKGRPFDNSRQVISEITHLPPISSLGSRINVTAWTPYIRLAKRLRVTESKIVASALEQFSSMRGEYDMDTRIRVMLLLRVCFECPSGIQQSNTYGGWLSYSAREAGKTSLDANWPVGGMAGWFYLQDSINGYLGRPYDPETEFNWRLANCKWRDL